MLGTVSEEHRHGFFEELDLLRIRAAAQGADARRIDEAKAVVKLLAADPLEGFDDVLGDLGMRLHDLRFHRWVFFDHRDKDAARLFKGLFAALHGGEEIGDQWIRSDERGHGWRWWWRRNGG